MHKKKLIIIAVLLGLTALSCGKRPPQQPAIAGGSAVASLRAIVSAYEIKDISSFSGKIARDFPDREAFLRTVAAVFGKYDSIMFRVQYTKMLIMIEEAGGIRLTFTWDAEWRVSDRLTKDGGRVTFVFDPAGSLLRSIEGKDPFAPDEKRL